MTESKLEKWKRLTGEKIQCQNECDDHRLCPECNEQLYFCDCVAWLAQEILEKEHGFDDEGDE